MKKLIQLISRLINYIKGKIMGFGIFVDNSPGITTDKNMVNTIYFLDHLVVSNSGKKSYSTDLSTFKVDAVTLGIVGTTGSCTLSVEGNTVSWNIIGNTSMTILVTLGANNV